MNRAGMLNTLDRFNVSCSSVTRFKTSLVFCSIIIPWNGKRQRVSLCLVTVYDAEVGEQALSWQILSLLKLGLVTPAYMQSFP